MKMVLGVMVSVLFFSLFSFSVFAECTRTTSTETCCENGVCTTTLYSGSRFGQNSLGEWVDPSDILYITKSSDDITFHYDGLHGYYNVTFETGVIYNGNYFPMATVKQNYPELNFNFPSEKHSTYRKYAVNITDIDQTGLDVNKIWNVTLTYKEHYGFTLGQLQQGNRWFKIKNTMALYFEDLRELHPLSINISEKRIYISNISANIIDGNLYLDPTLQLQDADTENLEDTYVDIDFPTTDRGNGDWMNLEPADENMYLKFNLSKVVSGATITESKLGIYAYTSGSTGTAKAHHVYNQTWNENDVVWNDQPCNAHITNSLECNLTSVDSISTINSGSGWHVWTVTHPVKSDYGASKSNVSFVINKTGGGSDGHRSKEEATETAQRPYLNVTYTVYPQWFNNDSSTPVNYTNTASEFNITWNTTDASLSNISAVFLESNYSGLTSNYTMTNDTYGGDIFNYSAVIGAGTFYWKSYANNTGGYWNSSDSWTFTIAQNSSTEDFMNLTIESTEGNSTLAYDPTGFNVTGWYSSTIFSGQTITFTLYRNGSSLGTTNPITDTPIYEAGEYLEYIYNTSGNTNFSSASKLYTLNITEGTPTIYSFGFNDTYITINETIQLSVNASQNANVSAEIQTSGGTTNHTVSWDGTNYTLNLSNTELGAASANATQVNLTAVYTNGQNYTMTKNTSTSNFDYAVTTISTTYSPSEPTNMPGATITLTTYYNTSESTAISNNCTMVIGVASYDMDFSVNKHEETISTEGWSAHDYSYTVTCVNSSYENQTDTGSFTLGGQQIGGGGGGFVVVTENITVNVTVGCGNEVCDADLGEDWVTCPQDCEMPALAEAPFIRTELFILVISGLALVYLYSKRKEKKKKGGMLIRV